MKVSRFLRSVGSSKIDGLDAPEAQSAIAAAQVPKAYQGVFASNEWRVLQLGPIWVMSAVGYADGVMDDKEKAAFFEVLYESPKLLGALARDVFMSTYTEFEDVFHAFAADHRSPKQVLPDIAALLDEKADHEEAVMYKTSLIGVGMQIASASGPMIGSNLSSEEELALSWIATWLDVDWDEARATLARYGSQGVDSDPDLPGQYL